MRGDSILKTMIKKSLIIFVICLSCFAMGFLSAYELLRINKKNVSEELLLAATGVSQGKDLPKKLEYLYASVFLNKKMSPAYFELGEIFYKMKEYDVALVEFQNLIKSPDFDKIDKHHLDKSLAYCFVADIYEKTGNQILSNQNYINAIKTNPYLLGYLAISINDKKNINKTNIDYFKLNAYENFYNIIIKLTAKNLKKVNGKLFYSPLP